MKKLLSKQVQLCAFTLNRYRWKKSSKQFCREAIKHPISLVIFWFYDGPILKFLKYLQVSVQIHTDVPINMLIKT